MKGITEMMNKYGGVGPKMATMLAALLCCLLQSHFQASNSVCSIYYSLFQSLIPFLI